MSDKSTATTKIKIYHNSRCRKSREGLEYLKSKGIEFEVVDYLKGDFSEKDLKDILLRMNKKASEIVRQQEDLFKKELKGKKFTEEEWITLLVENPQLLQRPIVMAKYKAVIAQPANRIDELF